MSFLSMSHLYLPCVNPMLRRRDDDAGICLIWGYKSVKSEYLEELAREGARQVGPKLCRPRLKSSYGNTKTSPRYRWATSGSAAMGTCPQRTQGRYSLRSLSADYVKFRDGRDALG